MQKPITAFLLTAAFVLQFTSCKKDKDENPAPEIPPQSSFVMDNSSFSGTKSVDLTNINYVWAAANVNWWNAVLTVNLAVPVASYKEAFNHQAVYDPQTSSWVWTYTVTSGNDTYTAALHAKLVADGVRWEMYISKSGAYSNFLWYYGVSDVSTSSGYWVLKNSAELNQDYIRIDWHNTHDGVADIRYENILAGTAEVGSYIKQSINNDVEYNAAYDIYLSSTQHLCEIKWLRPNQNGRVKDSMHFGDSNWHCWDASHADMVCQ